MDALTNHFIMYIALIGVISVVGILNKSPFPTSLLLVIVGMGISLIPHFPQIEIHSELILNVFLPLLLYEASAYASWRDFKKNITPIAYLSIGHVIFITILVACGAYYIIPQLSWPMAFVVGAVISPPDDVAIIAIAEKVHFPRRIITILKGESLLNDATALILFRFALVAIVTHEFSLGHALVSFFAIVIGETIYGLVLGYIVGQIRLRIQDTTLQIIFSLITPFLAFLVPERLGGSGVIATVCTGIVVGTNYLERFRPEVRLSSMAVWTTVSFLVQNLLFLLIGLDLRYILSRISEIPVTQLLLYSFSIIAIVVIGRFIWIFSTAPLPYLFNTRRRKNQSLPAWQYLFIASWAGLRGGISLAAALAVPALPSMENNVDPRDLLVFLVFSVISFTLLIQGMTLPWLLKILGITKRSEQEKYADHVTELRARKTIAFGVLKWLKEYKTLLHENTRAYELVQLRIQEYEGQKKQLTKLIKEHDDNTITHQEKDEFKTYVDLAIHIITIERTIISRLWDEGKIDHDIKIKLTQQLDHREKQVAGYI